MDMGAKIRPGTPVIVNSGMNATTMIAVEKKMGRPTCLAARTMTWGTVRPVRRSCAKWKKMLSTITSVASTMIPKSIAPSEIKFADCLISTIIVNVKSNDSGIVSATMIEARKFPRNTSRIRKTRTIPLMRMSVTVSTVVWINAVRS